MVENVEQGHQDALLKPPIPPANVGVISSAQHRSKGAPHEEGELIRVEVTRVDWLEQLFPALGIEDGLEDLSSGIDLRRRNGREVSGSEVVRGVQ